MTIYLSEQAAQRAGLVTKARAKRGRATRPDIPAAGRAPSTGLSTLLVAGWSIEMRVGVGYRMDKGELSTGWCASEAAVCAAAKEIGR